MNLTELSNVAWAGPAFAGMVNHLWQSTVVVATAWLLALALRKNHARVRYWVWMAASAKFLVPFSLLVDLGARLQVLIPSHVVARPVVANVMEQVAQPFAAGVAFEGANSAVAAHGASAWPAVLLVIWACGAMVVAIKWTRGWLHLRRAVRAATPVRKLVLSHPSGKMRRLDGAPSTCGRIEEPESKFVLSQVSKSRPGAPDGDWMGHPQSFAELAADVPVLCSEGLLEPGIFGIFRPVLLLPEGILERLSAEQLRAIVAHEMCHVRRRDNLMFALHMMVEILFWFYPAVWWIGARLVEERERACDEAVVSKCGKAQVYAEGILNVCKFYVEAPSACAAGVTGSDLKKRIMRIMSDHAVCGLDLRRRALLGVAGLLAVALPLGVGLIHTGGVIAETKAEDELANLPKFDVASVKPHKNEPEGMMRMGFGLSPDGINADGVPLQMIVRQAFGVSDDRILNEPDWVKSTRYDMQAKVSPEDAPKLKALTQRQRGLMLLPILEDRFDLKFHHETRELEVYTLVVAKGGPKLKTAQPEQARGDGPVGAGPGPGGATGPRTIMRMSPQGMTLDGRSATIESLAGAISRELGATVIDKTGLTDKYDYTLSFMPETGTSRALNFLPPPPPPPSGGGTAGGGGSETAPADTAPSLTDAVQQQLGLKLVKQTQPVDVIVIDHIEQPSAN